MTKGWLLLKKAEMTKLWVDGKHVPVTLLSLLSQEVIKHRTVELDWYSAVVVWVWKKEKWDKIVYDKIMEFRVAPSELSNFEVWSSLDLSLLEWVDKVVLKWSTKWRGFQWVIKRHWFSRWPETHWSHFHRRPGSVWWMKPRRVHKWKKLPWHMWSLNVTVKWVKVVDKLNLDWEELLAVKWSVPSAYWSTVRLELR